MNAEQALVMHFIISNPWEKLTLSFDWQSGIEYFKFYTTWYQNVLYSMSTLTFHLAWRLCNRNICMFELFAHLCDNSLSERITFYYLHFELFA